MWSLESHFEALQALKLAFQALTGSKLELSRWQESLYERLSANEVVFQIADALKVPRPLGELVRELEGRLGRPVPEEEIIAWLALGATSRREGRPLLRPVVHAFVRGVGGAVVTFPEGLDSPRLWLSREEAATAERAEASGGEDAEAQRLVRLDVMTCTTCGQHYFIHFVSDFDFTGRAPGGGEAVEERVVWKPLEQKSGGSRVVLLDRLVSEAEDEEDEPRNTAAVYLCRRCGTLHPQGTGILYDREGRMFSRSWHESDVEVMRGSVPMLSSGPEGLKLRRRGSSLAMAWTQGWWWASTRPRVTESAGGIGSCGGYGHRFLPRFFHLAVVEVGGGEAVQGPGAVTSPCEARCTCGSSMWARPALSGRELWSLGSEVIEVAYGDLTDREAMRRHLARLGRALLGKERATTCGVAMEVRQKPFPVLAGAHYPASPSSPAPLLAASPRPAACRSRRR